MNSSLKSEVEIETNCVLSMLKLSDYVANDRLLHKSLDSGVRSQQSITFFRATYRGYTGMLRIETVSQFTQSLLVFISVLSLSLYCLYLCKVCLSLSLYCQVSLMNIQIMKDWSPWLE